MSLLKKLILSAAVLILAVSAIGFSASAEPFAIDGIEIPIDIVINGTIINTPVNAFLDGGTTYVPVRAISEAMGATVTWDANTRVATVSRYGQNINFAADSGTAVIYKDTLFVPTRTLAESLGYAVTWDDYYCQVNISAPGVYVPAQCVKTEYTNSDILIVAQVLTCECGSAPFNAKIAVGNVICNRAASDLFPDTVTEVIYDKRYGSVQFTIAYNGKLNNTPSRECILAAKCALSGVVIAKDCLFFQAHYVTNSWMDRNRQYAMTLGGNKFFY